MCIFKLFVADPPTQPDSRMMFLHPLNRQEFIHNQQYVQNIQYRNNIPIYLHPAEYLDNMMPQFMMLQLYYLWIKFKNSNPMFGPPGSPQQVPELVFRDHGRKPPASSSS